MEFSSEFHCWIINCCYIEIQLIFVWSSGTHKTFWLNVFCFVLIIRQFSSELLEILYIYENMSPANAVFLFLQSGWLLFPFIFLSFSPPNYLDWISNITMQCWIERKSGHPCFALVLEEKLSCFSPTTYGISLGFFIDYFY